MTDLEKFRQLIDGWAMVGGDASMRVYFDISAEEFASWRRGASMPRKGLRDEIASYIRRRVERAD